MGPTVCQGRVEDLYMRSGPLSDTKWGSSLDLFCEISLCALRQLDD